MVRLAKTRIALVSVAALVALAGLPAAANAAAPATAAKVLRTEGFEVGSKPTYTVGTYFPSAAQWGAVARARTGARGLWVAGSRGLGASYPTNTHGVASFAAPGLKDYYSSKLSFYYLLPSVGGGEAPDQGAFSVQWWPTASQTDVGSRYPWPLTGSWKAGSVDLSAGNAEESLSRKAGTVTFYFADTSDPAGSARTGEGPTIDDVKITAWKYGPVRGLKKSGPTAGVVRLTWQRPWRSTAATALEERAITYRIWKAPRGTSTWSEVTKSRLSSAETTVTYTHATSTSYRYLVQAWDSGSGTGYGVPVESMDLRTPSRPSSAVVGTSFTSSGYLWPRHTSGSTSVVKVECYRSAPSGWVLEKTVSAKLSNYSSYSKYSAKVTLPKSGTWRLRAVAPADSAHAAVNSGYTSSFSAK